ncbi:hypothetical protein [Microbacterium sp. 179-I 3D4 NHS]|uniref:hypothetical protein n=1 Tax=Microbacterium sp. 179-I 3D4 NHS TaxID=3142381 RepID=UPI0039A3F271
MQENTTPSSDRIDEAKPEADVEEQRQLAFEEDAAGPAPEWESVVGVEADAADVADQLREVPVEDERDAEEADLEDELIDEDADDDDA